ncbi:MAG: response regulator [Pseudomonas sp.]
MGAVILLVEDDMASLELAAYLLGHAGHQVHRAVDGAQGLQMARSLQPSADLILSDIQMPVMDGYQLLAALREDKSLCDTPVVAITAFSMCGDEQKILASGFNGYISKPIDPEQFASQVGQWLPVDLQS